MGSRGCDTDGAAVTAALLEPTPIGESIIGGIILRWALSKAKAPEDGVVVESEKPEDDTVPSETPDDAATPDTPKPTIEGQKTESSARPKVIDEDTDMSDPSTWPLPEGVMKENLRKVLHLKINHEQEAKRVGMMEKVENGDRINRMIIIQRDIGTISHHQHRINILNRTISL